MSVGTETAIPVFQTVSLRKTLETFGESIIEFDAKGGILNTRRSELDKEYGIDRIDKHGGEVEMNYRQKRDLSGVPTNPLDSEGIARVISHLKRELPPVEVSGKTYQPDIAVGRVIIEKNDPELAKIIDEVTPWFDGDRTTFLIYWRNDRAEERKGDQATRPLDVIHAKNRGLGIQAQGFQGRVLNARQIIERARIFGDEKELYVANWGGPEDRHPKFPADIGRYVYEHYLPTGFSELNYYYTDQQATLQLDGWVMK